MKSFFLSLLSIGLLNLCANAQVKEGTVTFEQKSKSTIYRSSTVSGNTSETVIKITKHQLTFNSEVSLFKEIVDTETPDPFTGGTNAPGTRTTSFSFSTSGGGELYKNYATKQSIRSTEFNDKKYLVLDSIKTNGWKLLNETKEILGYTCRKAVRYITVQSSFGPTMRLMSMNGQAISSPADTAKPKSREAEIVAWYAESIPVTTGPENYDQLPGLVLQVDYDNGQKVLTAIALEKKYDKKELQEPKKGQQISATDFAKMRADAINKANSGGNGTFINMGGGQK